MFLSKRERDGASINGSSMADIAFLLLIFFLVTTTINVDTGIAMVLPPPPEDIEIDIPDRNLLTIFVNSKGEILLDNRRVEFEHLKPELKLFINNWGTDPELSDSPERAIISLKTQKETPYKIYIDMLDELMGVYVELRNEASLARYGVEFSRLSEGSASRNYIKELYPKRISLAQ
ncbi:MAG: biopolymer transporter ExbD [Balneola sp.]|nr:MAG: biopolymer transporter ExbD [Balneola sp.]